MKERDSETEQLIKDTAKKIFFAEGKLHATTQEIADAAGINRASIHYYFRSRQQLFDTVFNEAVVEMRQKLQTLFEDELPFRAHTETFIDLFIEKSIQQPYLELFIIAEYNTDPTLDLNLVKHTDKKARLQHLQHRIDEEVAAGNMKPMTSQHYLVTLTSLCSFPFLGKSILQHSLLLDEKAYKKMISERKQMIMQLLFLNA